MIFKTGFSIKGNVKANFSIMNTVRISDAVKIQATKELFNKGYLRRKSNNAPSDKCLLKLYKRLFKPRLCLDDFFGRIRNFHLERSAIPEFNGITRINYCSPKDVNKSGDPMGSVISTERKISRERLPKGETPTDKAIRREAPSEPTVKNCHLKRTQPKSDVNSYVHHSVHKVTNLNTEKNKGIHSDNSDGDRQSEMVATSMQNKALSIKMKYKVNTGHKTSKSVTAVLKTKSNLFKPFTNRKKILQQLQNSKRVKLKLPRLDKETVNYIINRQIRLQQTNSKNGRSASRKKRRKGKLRDPSYRFTGGKRRAEREAEHSTDTVMSTIKKRRLSDPIQISSETANEEPVTDPPTTQTTNHMPPMQSRDAESTNQESAPDSNQFRSALLTTYNKELHLGSRDAPIVLSDETEESENDVSIDVNRSLTSDLNLEELSFDVVLDDVEIRNVPQNVSNVPVTNPSPSRLKRERCEPESTPILEPILSPKKPSLAPLDIKESSSFTNVRYRSPDIADTPTDGNDVIPTSVASEPIESARINELNDSVNSVSDVQIMVKIKLQDDILSDLNSSGPHYDKLPGNPIATKTPVNANFCVRKVKSEKLENDKCQNKKSQVISKPLKTVVKANQTNKSNPKIVGNISQNITKSKSIVDVKEKKPEILKAISSKSELVSSSEVKDNRKRTRVEPVLNKLNSINNDNPNPNNSSNISDQSVPPKKRKHSNPSNTNQLNIKTQQDVTIKTNHSTNNAKQVSHPVTFLAKQGLTIPVSIKCEFKPKSKSDKDHTNVDSSASLKTESATTIVGNQHQKSSSDSVSKATSASCSTRPKCTDSTHSPTFIEQCKLSTDNYNIKAYTDAIKAEVVQDVQTKRDCTLPLKKRKPSNLNDQTSKQNNTIPPHNAIHNETPQNVSSVEGMPYLMTTVTDILQKATHPNTDNVQFHKGTSGTSQTKTVQINNYANNDLHKRKHPLLPTPKDIHRMNNNNIQSFKPGVSRRGAPYKPGHHALHLGNSQQPVRQNMQAVYNRNQCNTSVVSNRYGQNANVASDQNRQNTPVVSNPNRSNTQVVSNPNRFDTQAVPNPNPHNTPVVSNRNRQNTNAASNLNRHKTQVVSNPNRNITQATTNHYPSNSAAVPNPNQQNSQVSLNRHLPAYSFNQQQFMPQPNVQKMVPGYQPTMGNVHMQIPTNHVNMQIPTNNMHMQIPPNRMHMQIPANNMHMQMQANRMHMQSVPKPMADSRGPNQQPNGNALKMRPCFVCSLPTEKVCLGCKAKTVCSEICQRRGWPTHKSECLDMQRQHNRFNR